MVRWREVLCVVFGVVAVVWPALAWAFVVDTQLRDPKAFHDQGGMFITIILCPLAFLGALVCGVPAIVLAAVQFSHHESGRTGWGWGLVGGGLSVVGVLLAVGTCIGPQMLAEAIR